MKILKVKKARLGKTPILKRVEGVRMGEDVLVPAWVSKRCLKSRVRIPSGRAKKSLFKMDKSSKSQDPYWRG